MKKFKTIVFLLPEYILIIAVIFYWGSAGILVN